MRLDILYEDDSLLFVNKPPHLIVQRGFDADEPTLLEMAEDHTSPVFLMQRLDRGTSGVMFFSKQARVNRALTRFFETRRIQKRYVALCVGQIGERQTIDAPLVRIGAIKFGVENTHASLSSRAGTAGCVDWHSLGQPSFSSPASKQAMTPAVSLEASARDLGVGGLEAPERHHPGPPDPSLTLGMTVRAPKRAVTHIEPIANAPHGSLVTVHLETGRTHQIRVHLAAIGHPLVGDRLYGKRDAERPMLHSVELAMPHPLSGEALRVTAAPPDDFLAESTRLGLVQAGGQDAPSGVQLNY